MKHCFAIACREALFPLNDSGCRRAACYRGYEAKYPKERNRSMCIEFTKVETGEQMERLACMADRVWHEYFTIILKPEQIDYMVDKFQSVPAIKEQMKNGYVYYFIMAEGQYAGYTGIHKETQEERLFLSKLYIMKEHRKKGIASAAFEFLKDLCMKESLRSIYLTVNRFNLDTIEVYKAKGFRIIKEQVTSIGNGYVMDDYVMELALDN